MEKVAIISGGVLASSGSQLGIQPRPSSSLLPPIGSVCQVCRAGTSAKAPATSPGENAVLWGHQLMSQPTLASPTCPRMAMS